MEEVDTWRSAWLLVQQHGERAELVAAERLGQLVADGDVAGWEVWAAILRAVHELQRRRPFSEEQMN